MCVAQRGHLRRTLSGLSMWSGESEQSFRNFCVSVTGGEQMGMDGLGLNVKMLSPVITLMIIAHFQ